MEIVITESRTVAEITEGVSTVVVKPIVTTIETGLSVTARTAYVNMAREYVCASATSALRAVSVTATGEIAVTDPSDPAVRHVVGITTTSGGIGEVVNVQYGGVVADAVWNWVEGGTIYVSGSGVLTQTPPTGGSLFVVGVAVGATAMQINLQESILLG